jgi:PDZ domain-containing protein
VLLVVAAGVLWFVPSNEYIYLPDAPRNVDPLVRVPGETDVDEKGGIYMVDIIVRKASLLERLFPQIHSGATLVPAKSFNPGNLPENVRREQSLSQMTASQKVATAVALRASGYKVETLGVEVSEVEVGAPADGPLEPGDIILAAQGDKVTTPGQLREVMSGVEPGETVTLRIQRDGAERTVTVGTKASSDTPPRAIMGILIEPKLRFPLDISIDAGDIGGPSAGLAFALDIYDELGHDIDDDERIVATGELALDGRVLEIGGIKQKTVAASDADADLFLVPDANAAAARRYADGLDIVPVSNFREALSALATT